MGKVSRKKLKISDNLVYAVLVISGLNFMLRGIYILGVFALIYIAFNHSFIKTKAIIPIAVFGVFYSLFLFINELGVSDMIKGLLFPVVWLFGYIFATNASFSRFMKALVCMAYGMAAHGILNLVYNISIGNNYMSGQAYDIFTHKLHAATAQAANFTMIVALVFWLVFIQKNKLLKIISIVVYLVAVYYDVSIGGRTFLILSLFSLVFSSVMYISTFLRDRTKRRSAVFIIVILITVFVLVLIAYEFNWFNISKLFSLSYLNTRLQRGSTLMKNDRFDRKLFYLSNILEYPWGGHRISTINNISYAHDIWLDTLDEAGIPAFVSLLIFSVCSIARFIRVCFLKSVDVQYRIVLINFVIIVTAQMFVEPIIKSLPVLFFMYLVIDGMLKACINNEQGRIYRNENRNVV